MFKKVTVDGGYAEMFEGGVVDGMFEISAEIYTHKHEWLETQGWQVDPTSYYWSGIPDHVIADIRDRVKEG